MKHWFDPGSERCEGCGAHPMCPNDARERERKRIIKMIDDLGLYPAATLGTERTEKQAGWNQAVFEILALLESKDKGEIDLC